MKLTLEADYAVRIIHVLSLAEGKLCTSYLSETCEIPLRFTSKILLSLVSANLVVSARGVNGGYRLAKAPEEISLLDVIEAVGGPLEIHRCDSGGHPCEDSEVKKMCRIKDTMSAANESTKDLFGGIKFDQFM